MEYVKLVTVSAALGWLQTFGLIGACILAFFGFGALWATLTRLRLKYFPKLPKTMPRPPGVKTMFGYIIDDPEGWQFFEVKYANGVRTVVHPIGWYTNKADTMVKLGQLGLTHRAGSDVKFSNMITVYNQYNELKAVVFDIERKGAKSSEIIYIVSDLLAIQ